MGAILLASEERERPRLDVEFEGSASSTTSTSSDSDEEAGPSVFGAMPTSRGLQGSVEVTSGFSKRTYGMNLAYEPTSSVERMLKCARLDEQLDGLRALLPHSARRTDRNDPCVVMDAYRYIVTLQQEVDDLSAELLECEEESCAHSETSDQQPLVEVMKRGPGGLEVRIVCANRPGLLVDVMEAVESRGLTITQARISCHSDDIVVKYLSLENEESASISLSTEGGSEEADGEELDSVKTMLVDAICEGR